MPARLGVSLLLLLAGCNAAKQPAALARSDSSEPRVAPLDGSAGSSDGGAEDASTPDPTLDATAYMDAARTRCPAPQPGRDASLPPIHDEPDPKPLPPNTVIPFGPGMYRPVLLEGEETPHWAPEITSAEPTLILLRCTLTEGGQVTNCRFIKTSTDERLARLIREAVLSNLACRKYQRYRYQGKFVSLEYVFAFRVGGNSGPAPPRR